ncbi:MAG: hypothetical protein IPN71_20130 [Fibrobacteres bacterium]|nr:hypothetical protein [Fibrobacterota bacterium]
MGGSPTYLAKIANILVRGGAIGPQRGSQGGFVSATIRRKQRCYGWWRFARGSPRQPTANRRSLAGRRSVGITK